MQIKVFCLYWIPPPPFLKKCIYFELIFGNIQSLRRAFDEDEQFIGFAPFFFQVNPV